MKKIIAFSIATLSLSTILTGCIKIGAGSVDYGEQVSQTVTVSGDFHEIETRGTTDIEFQQGPLSLTLTAPEKLMDNITIEVKDGKLIVDQKNEIHNLSQRYNSKLTVSAPTIDTFTTSGTGDINLKGLNGKEISLLTYGTGDITLTKARCTKLNAVSSGTGDIDISYLNCIIAECNTSGTGDIDIKRLVAEKISGNSSGTGDITVSGECRDANLQSSGMGDINQKGLEILKSESDD